MFQTTSFRTTALVCLAAMASQSPAQTTFFPDSVVIDGQLSVEDKTTLDGPVCMGDACTGVETLEGISILFRTTTPSLIFEDSSPLSEPDRQWTLRINDMFPAGIDRFSVEDDDANTTPFTIEGNAPDNAFWLDDTGRIGLGTMLPQDSLHVVGQVGTALLLEQTGTTNIPAQAWRLRGGAAFQIVDVTQTLVPLTVERAAPDDSFYMTGGGKIGLGTDTPAALLHMRRTDNSARLLIEDTGASGAQEMLKLSNNGGSYFTFENTAAGTTWFFTHENASPNRFIIADGVADGPEMTLTASGNLTIPGNFISGATTLNVPDYVFEPGYELRPLSEVAAFVQQNKHLPDVPSAADIATDGLDMTQMQMTLLKKIEELTLYTLEQQDLIQRQRDEIARMQSAHGVLAAQVATLIAAP